MFHRNLAPVASFALIALLSGSLACASGHSKEARAEDEVEDQKEDEAPITGEALEKASAAALASTGGGRVTGTEVGDEESYYEVEVTTQDGRKVDVQLDRQFKVVSSDSDEQERGDDEDDDEGEEDDDEVEDRKEKEVPITGEALEKARAAALASTGGGRVTGTEVGDEESYYEVEVTTEDGRRIDVQLDEQFEVVSSDSDEEERGDDED
jgi:uncharacterized membrane protein YkoI